MHSAKWCHLRKNFVLINGGITMANKHINISNTAKAVLAIIAGILCLFWFSAVQWIVGIFLIVWGVLELIDK
jgi:uncharacterized membrane protein HdeD (DUF308 family)